MMKEFDKLDEREKRMFGLMVQGGIESILMNKGLEKAEIVPWGLLYDIYLQSLEEIKSGGVISNIN